VPAAVKIRDGRSAQVTRQLAIVAKSGSVKKRFSWGYARNYGGWWSAAYKARLPRGTYYIRVYGRTSPAHPERDRQGVSACEVRRPASPAD